MEKVKLYQLLSRYLSKSIQPSEWDELVVLLENSDDANVSDVLERLWEEEAYMQTNRSFERELEEILANIRAHADAAVSIDPSSDDAIAPTPKRFVRNNPLRVVFRIAGILLIIISVGLGGYFYKDREFMAYLRQKEMVVHAAGGQRIIVTLPDSSVVHLNSASSLSYKQDFGYKDRNVRLEGEAFFEIRTDEAKKFTVQTEHLQAEVLGTCFNFYAYENENVVELALVEGSVSIETKRQPFKQIRLKPEEKVVYDKKTGSLKLEKANISFDTAWMRGELVFRSELIEDVLYKIERRYGVTITVLGEGLQSDRFTGYFGSHEIRDVMDELKTHYNFTYKVEGEQIWINTGDEK